MILIGYSGHGYVAAAILKAMGKPAAFYCENEEKKIDPFKLIYLGSETSELAQDKFKNEDFFISIGQNSIRKRIFEQLASCGFLPINIGHPSAIIDETSSVTKNGIMVAAGVCINPLVKIGNGVICNTGCIIEHECNIGDFCHVAPGAILCGNVTLGNNSFVGAGSVIKQGIIIGKNVTIGAGSVVIKNVADNETVAGNPSRKIK